VFDFTASAFDKVYAPDPSELPPLHFTSSGVERGKTLILTHSINNKHICSTDPSLLSGSISKSADRN